MVQQFFDTVLVFNYVVETLNLRVSMNLSVIYCWFWEDLFENWIDLFNYTRILSHFAFFVRCKVENNVE